MKLFGVLDALRAVFSHGGTANTVGNVVANGATWVALIAALSPAAYWLLTHKDDVAVTFTLTYAQLGVMAALIFGPLALVLKIIHYTRPGKPDDRAQTPGG